MDLAFNEVIDGATNHVIANLSASFAPQSVGYDPINGNEYITCITCGNAVDVVSATTFKDIAVFGEGIFLGEDPAAMPFNSRNGDVYIITEY